MRPRWAGSDVPVFIPRRARTRAGTVKRLAESADDPGGRSDGNRFHLGR